MNFVLTLLASIGGIFLLLLIASAVLGRFGNKRALGEVWIKKNLKAAGFDAEAVEPELIGKIANSAYLTSVGLGPDFGKYKPSAFKSDLDYKSRLLIRHLSGGQLNDDEKFLIGLIDELPLTD